MEDREYRQIEEYPDPAPEDTPDAEKEFGALPDEFSAGAPAEAMPRRRKRRRGWHLAAAAVAVGFVLVFPGAGTASPAPEPGTAAVPGQTAVPGQSALPGQTASPGQTAAPGETQQPGTTSSPAETDAPPDATETPVETETPAPTYPLSDGIIVLTVYNNTFDFTGIDWSNFTPGDELKVLLQQEIADAEFTPVTLPAAEPDEDDSSWKYEFTGWALHYNADFDNGYDASSAVEAFIRPVGDVITREDVEAVPPAADGTRYVNVHAMWCAGPSDDPLLALLLDDGMGNATLYEGETPYASEGFTYLAAFPVPERVGYRFTGWYDGDGNKVEYLTYFEFYENPRLVETETSSYWDADWDHPVTVTLTAGWEKVN